MASVTDCKTFHPLKIQRPAEGI